MMVLTCSIYREGGSFMMVLTCSVRLTERQELASLAEDNQRYTATNPTYAVISGLCFTTQLLESLSCVLHVRLPRKISYR